MDMPLWEELIRTGENAYSATQRLAVAHGHCDVSPTWCFERFGFTRTQLPDGRVVCIAGEHEDHYDPDFFIYNDVIVISRDGSITIYGYPYDVFPPTDFHTATLVGDRILIVGRLGYQYGPNALPIETTPIFELRLSDFSIRKLPSIGDTGGMLSQHRAELEPDGQAIRIGGGKSMRVSAEGKRTYERNTGTFRLVLEDMHWEEAAGVVPTISAKIDLPEATLEYPEPWNLISDSEECARIVQQIRRSAALEHPLFAAEFWPMAQTMSWGPKLIQMLDGTQRVALVHSSAGMGRDPMPDPVTEFFPDFESWLVAEYVKRS